MKKILTVWPILYVVQVFAVDFRNFEEYKASANLLKIDIARLESLNVETNNKLYKDSLRQYKLLFEKHYLFESHLTLNSLLADAVQYQWKRTATKLESLLKICEGVKAHQSLCLKELVQLKLFVNSSNLVNENKKMITSFIDKYVDKTKKMAAFDEQFVFKFNENSRLLNQNVSRQKIAPVPVLKENLSINERAPGISPNANRASIYWFFSGTILFLLGTFIYRQRRNKLNAVKDFYHQIFQVGKKNKLKVKLFGNLDFSGFSVIKKIEEPFFESLLCSQIFSNEAHVNFKNVKNELKVETLFVVNRSIIGFLEKEAELLQEILDNLQISVAACNGECSFTKEFNINGEIVGSRLFITLPK